MSHDRSLTIGKSTALALLLLAAQAATAAPPLGSAGPLSSRFPGPLWNLSAPQGGTATVTNAHLMLTLPGGSNHEVRLVQPVSNSNFDVSIKIDSPAVATNANTSQGLVVVADNNSYLTFYVATNGTDITLTAHAVSQGAASTLFTHGGMTANPNPLYLRVSRSGNNYIAYYSEDGAVWTQAGSFSNGQVTAAVGPFASNYNANPARAVPLAMAVNWFNIL